MMRSSFTAPGVSRGAVQAARSARMPSSHAGSRAGPAGPARPARPARPAGRRASSARSAGAWAQTLSLGRPDAAELVRIGVDVDDGLARRGGIEVDVAAGGDVAEARAEEHEAVGGPEARAERRVHADREVAGVAGVAVVHVVLAAEGDGHRHALRGGEAGEIVRRPLATRAGRRRRGGGALMPAMAASTASAAGARSWRHGRGRGGDVGGVRAGREHVLGQRQHHRAGAAGQG